jgi:hypothetical protein
MWSYIHTDAKVLYSMLLNRILHCVVKFTPVKYEYDCWPHHDAACLAFAVILQEFVVTVFDVIPMELQAAFEKVLQLGITV